MDTSETYVKMSDHPKIQEQWKPTSCDWYYNKEFSSEIKYVDEYVLSNKQIEVLIKYCIWLPRQDDIQKMMNIDWWCFGLKRFFVWMEMNGRYVGMFKTLEQAWLAFYMQEKHGLIWDGEKWGEGEK